MHAIRSVLWIGPARGLSETGLADCPLVDATWVADVADALSLGRTRFDVEILDASDPERVIADLRQLRRAPRRPLILVRADAETADALRAAGARDVISRSADREALLAQVDAVVESEPWRDPGDAESETLPGVIGTSPALREVLALALRASRSHATVLVSGETGTGKEVIARAIHERGPRSGRPFVAVNCAAFPDSLLESELFGYARGAFTGADRDKTGLFAEADGGTLFLDEIGETSGPLQATLLRVLQEREVRPVGSARSRPVDVRVIAATNRSLRDEAARGFFREDLYYRLAVFPIAMPPLRMRRDDVLPLAEHFLARHGERDGKPDCRLSRPAAHLLVAHDWPGNVRELENEMQRALALAEPGGLVTPDLLSAALGDIAEPVRQTMRAGDSLRASMNRIEAWLIRRALEQNGDHRTATARKLGITREGLYKKMKRLGIE